jgi:hypothetical protein
MRNIILTAAASVLISLLSSPLHAEDRATLASALRDYDCTLTFPMATYNLNSFNRPGSLLESLPQSRVGNHSINYILKPKYCVDEEVPLPDVTEGVDLDDFAETTKVNATLKLEMQDIFKLFDVNYDYVDDVQVTLKNVKFLTPQFKVIARMAESQSKIQLCQSNVINPSTSRIITSACVADISYKFYFKEGFTATLADAFVKALKLKIGASLTYTKEVGSATKYVTVTSRKPVIIGINTEKTADYFKSVKLPTQPKPPKPAVE